MQHAPPADLLAPLAARVPRPPGGGRGAADGPVRGLARGQRRGRAARGPARPHGGHRAGGGGGDRARPARRRVRAAGDGRVTRARRRRPRGGPREWLAITLHTPDGRCVLDTARPADGAALEPDRVRAVLDRNAPVIAHEAGATPGVFAVRVPVLREGRPRYVLSAMVSAGVVS